MSIPVLILDFLTKKGRVSVPNFGVFFLENAPAVLDSDAKTLIPPGKQIALEPDYEVSDESFLDFIAESKNISKEKAGEELRAQTDYWKKMLLNSEPFSAEGLGNFYISDNQLVFRGNRFHTDNPDFYGLEEIKINELRNRASTATNQENPVEAGSYKFNKAILWIFLLIIPVLGMAYIGITQQELLFGKKSFDGISVKNSTHRIEKPKIISDSLQKDSLRQQMLKDSLNKDSLAKTSVIPVKKPVKNWTSTKKWSSKKYKSNKWKPKKRQTH